MYKNFFEAKYAISLDYVYIWHHWNTRCTVIFDSHQPEKVYNVLHDVSESK